MSDNGGLKVVETATAYVSKETSSILMTLPHNK
jgi:hypothetical protein